MPILTSTTGSFLRMAAALLAASFAALVKVARIGNEQHQPGLGFGRRRNLRGDGAWTPKAGHREIRRLRNKRQRKARAMHYRRLRFA